MTAPEGKCQVRVLAAHATPAVTHQTYSHVIGIVDEATAAAVGSMYDAEQEDDSAADPLQDTAG